MSQLIADVARVMAFESNDGAGALVSFANPLPVTSGSGGSWDGSNPLIADVARLVAFQDSNGNYIIVSAENPLPVTSA